jgi:hypothetical protein
MRKNNDGQFFPDHHGDRLMMAGSNDDGVTTMTRWKNGRMEEGAYDDGVVGAKDAW